MNHEGEFKTVLQEAGLRLFNVFEGRIQLEDTRIEQIVQSHDWLEYLKILISRSFPESETEIFFQRMEEDRFYNQLNCVNGLVEYLHPFISQRENLSDWAERLQLIINCTSGFNHEAYQVLKANLDMFLYAVYTHMGMEDKVHEVGKEFMNAIEEIQEIGQRDKLLIIFCNRQIVTDTDTFQFKDGQYWFEAVQSYYNHSLENSNDLMEAFSILANRENVKPALSEQYGRTIGSYIQLLAKAIRMADYAEKKNLAEIAENVMPMAYSQFSKQRDIDRCHQNLCDLLTELGRYEEAVRHLYQSINSQEITESDNAVGRMLHGLIEKTGNCGQKERVPFTYLHYVYVMHRCLRMKYSIGADMLDEIVKSKPEINEFEAALSNSPHPQGVICWHLAGAMAYRKEWQSVAKKLFEIALTSLENQGEIFRTIWVAVRAEQIALGLQGKLPGSEWKKNATKFWKTEYLSYAEHVLFNPYQKLLKNQNEMPDETLLFRVADLMPY